MSYLYARGKTYWIQYYENGARKQISLKTRDKTVAKFKQREIDNRLLLGESPLPNKNLTINDALTEFLDQCKVTVRPRTIKYYEQTLHPFIESLPRSTRPQDIADKIVTSYINARSGLNDGGAWHLIKVLKTFIRFCVGRKYLAAGNLSLRKPKLAKRPPECWTPEELKKVLAAINDPVVSAMVRANLYLGLRPSDAKIAQIYQ